MRDLGFEYGFLTRHRRVPTLLDCHMTTACNVGFWTVVRRVEDMLLDRGIKDFQLLVNSGKASVQFRCPLQIKLFWERDMATLMEPDSKASQDVEDSPEFLVQASAGEGAWRQAAAQDPARPVDPVVEPAPPSQGVCRPVVARRPPPP